MRGEETLEELQILTKGLGFQNGKGKGKMGGGVAFYFSNGQKSWSTFLNHENRESF